MKANHTEVRINPEVVAVLQARARRARAQAVHNVVIRLVQKLTPRLDLKLWGTHWG